jgi:CIC family chloride channel protein
MKVSRSSENNPGKILENTLLAISKNNMGSSDIRWFNDDDKSFATGITLGAGGNGGNFAPSYLWVPILAMCFQN